MRDKLFPKQTVLWFGATLLFIALWLVQPSTTEPRVWAQEVFTPTPTRSWQIVTEIIAPHTGDAISGITSIQGTALIELFRRYEIAISEAGNEDWQWLFSGEDYIFEGDLYRFDTTRLPDGFYDFRLRAVREDGNYTEAFRRNIEIRNTNPPTPTPQVNELGTPIPATPTVPTPTPTFTPEFVSFVPNGQGIFEPRNGGVMRGVMPIIGTANGYPQNPFMRYELYLSEAGFQEWILLINRETQIWQNRLYELDTRQYPDGLYDLRLRLVYRDSNYSDFEVRNVYIANYTTLRLPPPTPTPVLAGIFAPRSNTNIGRLLEFIGATDIPNLLRWELYWTPSGTENWARLVSSDKRVPAPGLLARLDLNQLPVGAYDFLLRVVAQDLTTQDFVVRQLRLSAPLPPATPTPTPFG